MNSNSILVIARKEFSDLVSSRLVVFILAFYVLMFILSSYNFYSSFDVSSLSSKPEVPDVIASPAGVFCGAFIMVACYYGGLVAVVLGYSSMSGEADGKALSTLLVKPLYRDTIVNGKLVGASCFLCCVFWVVAAFYLAGLFLFFGGVISACFFDFLGFLPLAFILYMLYTMLFFSLSMLMCITFKEQSLALFSGFFLWIFLNLMSNMMFMGYITSFFNFDRSTTHLISSLAPYNILSFISGDIVNSGGVFDMLAKSFSEVAVQVFALLLYCFVATVMAYASFIRRDVS